MKNVVFVAANPFNPDPRAEKQMISLEKNNYHVFAIGWDRFSNQDTIGKLGENIKVYRKGIPSDFGLGKKNLIPLIKWQFSLLKMLIKQRKQYDIIHAANFDSILPSLMMKLLFRKKVTYDIYDFYVDSFPVPNKLKKLVLKLDCFAIKSADAIILPTEYRLDQIRCSTYKKIAFIHNTPANTTIDGKINKKTDQLVISYVGVLQNDRFLDEMIEIVKSESKFTLNIAGFGVREKDILNNIKDAPNIHFLGKVDYSKSLKISNEADVLFCIYNPDIPNHKYSAPNKMYEAMMLGKPLLVAKNTGVDKIVDDEKIGFVVDYHNISDTKEALHALYENKQLREEMSNNALNVYENKYSWNEMEKRLLELYSSL